MSVIPLAYTLPIEEQQLMESRNPNPQNMEEHRANWNLVYSMGWVAYRFYVANRLREALAVRGFDEEDRKVIFAEVFQDLPEIKIINHDSLDSVPAQS